MCELLYHLLDSQTISAFRLKELLMFLTGYCLGELSKISLKSSSNIQCKMTVSRIVKRFEQKINQFRKMSKADLTNIFVNSLNLIRKSDCRTIDTKFIDNQFVSLIQNQMQLFYQHDQQKIIQNNPTQKETQKKPTKISSIQQQHQKPAFRQVTHDLQELACQICCNSLSSSAKSPNPQFLPLKINMCGHQYHIGCVFQVIKEYMNTHSNIILFANSQQVPLRKKHEDKNEISTLIKCPNFQVCQSFLSFGEVHQILSIMTQSSSQYSRYLQMLYNLSFDDYLMVNNVKSMDKLSKSMIQTDNFIQQKYIHFYCHTKGCNAVYELQTLKGYQNFVCFSCKKAFCLKCFADFHPTMTCKQYQISSSHLPEDEELQKFIKTMHKPYKKCPKCLFYVDNWRGCSTVKCRCGIEFCYKCGNVGGPHANCLKQIQKLNQTKAQRK